MGLSGSGINEENHIVSGSWIAWLIYDSIGTILSVPFCSYHCVPCHFVLEPFTHIEAWTAANKLQLNPHKSCELIVHRRSLWSSVALVSILQGVISMRFIGVVLSANLTWPGRDSLLRRFNNLCQTHAEYPLATELPVARSSPFDQPGFHAISLPCLEAMTGSIANESSDNERCRASVCHLAAIYDHNYNMQICCLTIVA